MSSHGQLLQETRQNLLKDVKSLMARNVSVLHVCTDFWPSSGGIEKFVKELSVISKEVCIEPSVLCLNRIKNEQEILPERDVIEDINIYRVPFFNLKYYKPSLLPLDLVREFQVIHVHGVGAQLDYLVLTKPLHGRPLILSTHGSIFHTKTLSLFKRVYFNIFQRFVLKGVDRIAACSQSDLDLFKVISPKPELVLNAVDLNNLLALPLNQKVKNRFLYVGRLANNKGLSQLLTTFSELYKKEKDFELHIVGPDTDKCMVDLQTITENLSLMDNVKFLGKVTDEELLQEYKFANFFVSASEYEGFGLSAVEAQASGCQLILQNNSAFSSLFTGSDGVMLIDYSNHSDAANVLFRSLSTDNNFSKKLRNNATKYTWEERISQWRNIYSSLANET